MIAQGMEAVSGVSFGLLAGLFVGLLSGGAAIGVGRWRTGRWFWQR